MITFNEVRDLQPGDVVVVNWPDGTTLQGPVVRSSGIEVYRAEADSPPELFGGGLCVGPLVLLRGNGTMPRFGHGTTATLTILERVAGRVAADTP